MKTLKMTLLTGLIIGCCCGTAMAVSCGGTPDCPVAPMPLPGDLPPSSTEMNPGGNWFDTGTSPTNVCFPASGNIAGVNQLRVGKITETQLFNKQPAIEVISAGQVYTFPMNGATLNAGGVLCVPGIGEAVAITNTKIGTVVGGKLTEHALPAGSTPVSAVIIGNCLRRNNLVELCVQTSAPSIEVVVWKKRTSFTIPAPPVATPDSFTNGPTSGVAVYTSTTVYVINGGKMTSFALTTGTYVSHAPAANGVNVTTTGGVEFVALAPACVIVPFAPCVLALDSCGAGITPSAIAVNIAPCPNIKAVTSTWPALGAVCKSTGARKGGFFGWRFKKSAAGNFIPTFGDIDAEVQAMAYTTATDITEFDSDVETIWNGGMPGTPGFPNPLLATAINRDGDDLATAMASIETSYDPVSEVLEIAASVNGGIALPHNEGHIGWFYASAQHPVVFEQWDADDDVGTYMRLSEDIFMPISTDTHSNSQTTLHFNSASTLSGLTELYTGTLVATHNYTDPNLSVTFESNPLLGLDDEAIEATLAAAFVYDTNEGGYRVPVDANILELLIDVPDGTTTFEISMDFDIEGTHYESGYFTCAELQAAGGSLSDDFTGPDDVPDCRVNLYDLAAFGDYWLDDSCGDPDWCGGTDVDHSGDNDLTDLLTVSEQWLMAPPVFPPHIWFEAWECPTQCSGDADCLQEGIPMTGFYWVGDQDLSILIAAMDTIIGNPNYDPRADFNRDGSVNQDDYDILIMYYKVKDPPQGPGIPDNCAVLPY